MIVCLKGPLWVGNRPVGTRSEAVMPEPNEGIGTWHGAGKKWDVRKFLNSLERVMGPLAFFCP
jgi:hypothetical protein